MLKRPEDIQLTWLNLLYLTIGMPAHKYTQHARPNSKQFSKALQLAVEMQQRFMAEYEPSAAIVARFSGEEKVYYPTITANTPRKKSSQQLILNLLKRYRQIIKNPSFYKLPKKMSVCESDTDFQLGNCYLLKILDIYALYLSQANAISDAKSTHSATIATHMRTTVNIFLNKLIEFATTEPQRQIDQQIELMQSAETQNDKILALQKMLTLSNQLIIVSQQLTMLFPNNFSEQDFATQSQALFSKINSLPFCQEIELSIEYQADANSKLLWPVLDSTLSLDDFVEKRKVSQLPGDINKTDDVITSPLKQALISRTQQLMQAHHQLEGFANDISALNSNEIAAYTKQIAKLLLAKVEEYNDIIAADPTDVVFRSALMNIASIVNTAKKAITLLRTIQTSQAKQIKTFLETLAQQLQADSDQYLQMKSASSTLNIAPQLPNGPPPPIPSRPAPIDVDDDDDESDNLTFSTISSLATSTQAGALDGRDVTDEDDRSDEFSEPPSPPMFDVSDDDDDLPIVSIVTTAPSEQQAAQSVATTTSGQSDTLATQELSSFAKLLRQRGQEIAQGEHRVDERKHTRKPPTSTNLGDQLHQDFAAAAAARLARIKAQQTQPAQAGALASSMPMLAHPTKSPGMVTVNGSKPRPGR